MPQGNIPVHYRQPMYSTLKNVQYLVAMLKKRGIRNIVVSPGTSHNAIVRCLDEDSYFKTYSITDERSACFFAIGLTQELHVPVVVMTTSGTATCNLLSGMTEAYYRRLPIIAVTADKHPYFLGQMEEQMIDQKNMFAKVTKAGVVLPIVKDKRDEWYCQRLLNEAFLELDHHGTGPIHIDVPIAEGLFAMGEWFNVPELPEVRLIERMDSKTEEAEWEALFKSLQGKKVVLLCGQDVSPSEEKAELIKLISQRYNCIVSTDTLTNLNVGKCIRTHRGLGKYHALCPDVVITLDGNIVSAFKSWLKYSRSPIEHWNVSEEGRVMDVFERQTKVVELSCLAFLKLMSRYGEESAPDSYYREWQAAIETFVFPEVPYSLAYACARTMGALPPGCMLHLGNSTTIRVAQYCDWDPSIRVFCNRGKHGIDGSMSAFIAQSSIVDSLSFLLIGDLSFYYDMNALWNRYRTKNQRIMLFNNAGASLFHFNQGLKNYPDLNQNVAAEHETTAEGWCTSQGYKYLRCTSQEEFEKLLPQFLNAESDAPILFEVYTDKALDGDLLHLLNDVNMPEATGSPQKSQPSLKHAIGQTRVGKALKVLIGKDNR